jgi:Spy/CpxP family protein refolding chaperone
MKRLVAVIFVLLVATAALAEPGGGPMRKSRMGGPGMGGPMSRNLFPPELVLMNQIALGLSEEQVASIKQQVNNTQVQTLDAQVQLHRLTEQLNATLENTTVDEVAALGLASRAMDQERRVKTAHLALMIRIKNLLTAEQQEKARALKPERRMGPPSPEPPAED